MDDLPAARKSDLTGMLGPIPFDRIML
ncbi:hypothetical protein NB311A_07648 [Nitrobacter sp. Nb-311A]|nr:hypothetical protein NB311A_07648 [Nitrobacter sp. Nb-311A]